MKTGELPGAVEAHAASECDGCLAAEIVNAQLKHQESLIKAAEK
jgi:hypothetical protein